MDIELNKLSELLTNEKMVKSIVKDVNNERDKNVNPAKRHLSRVDNELERLDKKKAKLFESY